jgi:DNA polymerase III epsilon subunit family exonuclease
MINPIRDFVAFDLETTGLERETDEIIEIGAVKVSGGAVTERMSRLVKAGKPLPALVEALTGITAAMLAEAGDLRDALEEFRRFAGDLPLVAHNSDFDLAFMQEALRKHGLDTLANPVFDSLLLARAAWPTFASHRLENLVARLGIPPQPAHRALPDAEQAALLWLKAQERMDSYLPATVASMRQVLAAGPAHWRDLFPAGDGAPAPAHFPAETAPASAAAGEAPVGEAPAGDVPAVESLFASSHGLVRAFAELSRPYDARPGQARMAALVERALQESRLLAVEAEPGTGRLLGSLVPAARHALARRKGPMGRPVLFSVSSRAMMERIHQEEFPVLRALFAKNGGIRLALLKPPSFYLSPRKFSEVMAHPETWLREEERLAMLPLLTWLEGTKTGDVSESTGFNHERHRLLWSKLASEGYLAEPGSFGHAAREAASRAHVALVSHELVIDDMALDFALLPGYEAIVFEEAHRLPEQVQARLGREIGFFRLKHLLQMLAFSKTETHGLVAELERVAAAGGLPPEAIEALGRIKERAFEPEKQLQKFFGRIAKQAQKRRKDGESKMRYADKLVVEFGSGPEPVTASLAELEDLLAVVARGLGEAAPAREARKVAEALRTYRTDLEHLAHPKEDAGEIFWIEEFPNPHRALIRCGPLDPGAILAERYHPQMSATVFASPGLAVGDQWNFFRRAAGLEPQRERLKTVVIRADRGAQHGGKPRPEPRAAGAYTGPGTTAEISGTPDLPEAASPATATATVAEAPAEPSARIFLAKFGPLMSGPGATQTVSEMLARALTRLGRSAFVFFTHVGLLKQSRAVLEEKLSGSGVSVLAQHVDGNRENLLHLFRHRKQTCLLGTETFVEGLGGEDRVPEICIVTKLPFPVPGEPLLAAALQKLQEAGGNPLHDLLLPSAVLKLKQELGRYPRARSGLGPILWILDPRLVTEKYSRSFLRGLGISPVICESEEELLARTETALKEG